MMYDFNANEVFEMAIQIENNGAAFYRKAAGLQPDESNRKFLEKMAAMEDHHKSTFEAMKTSVTDTEKTGLVFDPDDEVATYLSAMVDSHKGEGSPAAADSSAMMVALVWFRRKLAGRFDEIGPSIIRLRTAALCEPVTRSQISSDSRIRCIPIVIPRVGMASSP